VNGGHLPYPTIPDMMIKNEKNTKKLWRLLKQIPPRQLIIQYSDVCNASCLQCEMRIGNKFKRSKIKFDDAKRIIDHAAKKGFQLLSFTGGEPFIYEKEIIELIRHARKAGINYVRTGTNGFMFANFNKPDWENRIHHLAAKLSEAGLYTFWISIDSCEPRVHENMRGLPGVIHGIEKALPIFKNYGIYPAANMGINRNLGGAPIKTTATDGKSIDNEKLYAEFRKGFSKFYHFVTNLGFTLVNTCYPMSSSGNMLKKEDSAYGASSSDDIVRFTEQEKSILFQALFDSIKENRSKIRIFTPLSSVYSLTMYYKSGNRCHYPCRGGIDYFFVKADGADTFPCGFRGRENLGKFWQMDFVNLERKAYCLKCDWECFRDAAVLSGPVVDIKENPTRFLKRLLKDNKLMRLWLDDIRYGSACSFFSGKLSPRYDKMSVFN